jgi:hypothetical protein
MINVILFHVYLTAMCFSFLSPWFTCTVCCLTIRCVDLLYLAIQFFLQVVKLTVKRLRLNHRARLHGVMS